MNPVLRELQNVETSRIFGPTNTLAGQLVQVERDLARQQQMADRRVPAWQKADQPSPTSEIGDGRIPADGELTVPGLIGLGILATCFFWLPGALFAAAVLMWSGVSYEVATTFGWWAPPVAMAGPIAMRIVRQITSAQKAN